MSHKSWEAPMSALAEAADGLFSLAQPIPRGDKAKAQIARAAKAAGLAYSRAWDIWYGKARCVRGEELDAIRGAKIKRGQERTDELAAIAADFEAIATRAAAVLEGKARVEADAFRALAGRARRLAHGA